MKTKCELFWSDAGSPFSEDCKVMHMLALDGSRQPQRFVLPALSKPVERLRFDFADSPAIIKVAGVAIVDADGAVQWQWDGDTALFQEWHEASVSSVEGEAAALLQGDSLDPYCLLALPAEVMQRLAAGWAVEMELLPQEDTLHDLKTMALQSEYRTVAVSKLYLNQKKQFDLLIQEVAAHKHSLEQLTADNQALRQEVERLGGDNRLQLGSIRRLEENDGIIRKKLTDHHGVLKSITDSKWLRKLFPISDLPG